MLIAPQKVRSRRIRASSGRCHPCPRIPPAWVEDVHAQVEMLHHVLVGPSTSDTSPEYCMGNGFKPRYWRRLR